MSEGNVATDQVDFEEASPERNTGSRPAPRGTAFYSRRRAVTACQVCRARRTKCDNRKPSCSFCLKVGATCIQSPVDLSTFDPASLKILERLDELDKTMKTLALGMTSTQSKTLSNPSEAASSRSILVELIPPSPECIMKWDVLSDLSREINEIGVSESEPATTPGQYSLQSLLSPKTDLATELDLQRVNHLLDNFFNYAHVKNPVLDEQATRRMVQSIILNGIDWSLESCLTLLICALGCIARPFGPTLETMPGTSAYASAETLFHAAQRRIGIAFSSEDIISTQCLFLSAWRYFVQALASCQQLPFLNSLSPPPSSTICDGSPASHSLETLQQATYWSYLRPTDFSLTEEELAFYPPFLPTPPNLQPAQELEANRDSCVPRQTVSWYFYLSEISLRRLASNLHAEMLQLSAHLLSAQDALEALAAAVPQYEEQAQDWISSLPLCLSFVLRGHVINLYELIYWPFISTGTNIVNLAGDEVVLKGAGLGGMLNMENFITGYSGHEHEHRAALIEVLGKENAEFYFSRLLHYFFTEADAELFASLGLNCLRVPFNYRHFMDDDNPNTIKSSGFELLDRIVNICSKYNIYIVLDLHAVPGGQNQDWHSDSGLSKALFWEFRDFQDRAIQLWVAIASHYAGNPVIAGYNPLNEPADPQHTRLMSWYERAEKAIRAVDPDHILFLDGNTYAMDFSAFDAKKVLPNTVYSCHDYSMMGFPLPEQYDGTDKQKERLRTSFGRKVNFMREAGVPIWNGEFGPVYQDPRTDPDAETTNAKRFALLQEQLAIYKEFGGVSWSIWLYKDIGYQGMVYLDPESPYMRLIGPFIEKKQRLGLDFWACADKSKIDAEVYQPLISKLKEMIPKHLQQKKYPKIWTFDRQVERVIRECLMSEYLGWELAEAFRGKTKEELESLAGSFALEQCLKRDELNWILKMDTGVKKQTR
ncbi:glycoside hydrolase superfamily [Trichoderma asperelloides]|nr:glycoside hydrolase superfamily [Trichoderma asperelloides]